jgi:hypothetical protein
MIDEQKLMWARLKESDKQFLFDNLSSAMLEAKEKAGKHKLAYDNAVIDFVKGCMKFFSVEEIYNALQQIQKTIKLDVNWGRLIKEVHPNFSIIDKLYIYGSNSAVKGRVMAINRFYKPKGKAYSNKYYEVFRQKV